MGKIWGLLLLAVGLQACGGGGGDAFLGAGDSVQVGNTTVRFGSGFTPFVEGVIEVDQATISAGGSTVLRVRLIDAAGNSVASSGLSVSMSSRCSALDQAAFSSQAGGPPANTFDLNEEGVLSVVFTDLGCSAAGSAVTNAITAQLTIEDETLVATGEVTVTEGAAGGILLLAPLATTELALNGSVATVERPQSQPVEFRVVDGSGGQSPVQGQRVCFSLNTSVGGLSLSDSEAITGADGVARTVVLAGDVSTAVVVTATVAGGIGSSCAAIPAGARATQNDNIVVSTGLPDQDGFTLTTDVRNVEGYDRADAVANITVYLNDLFNNPVRDGLVVFFTAEGGTIQDQCSTLNGQCSVAWQSTNDKPFDGAVTITAYTIGEESFVDTNGNGLYDAGEPFGDNPEQVFDADLDGLLSQGLKCPGEIDPFAPKCLEEFADFNQNGIYDSADGLFTGSRCQSGCSAERSQYVGGSTLVVMSPSAISARFPLGNLDIPADGVLSFDVEVFGVTLDGTEQSPPAGSLVSISTDVGQITGSTNFVVPDIGGPYSFNVTIRDSGAAASGSFRVNVRVPSGLESLHSTVISQP